MHLQDPEFELEVMLKICNRSLVISQIIRNKILKGGKKYTLDIKALGKILKPDILYMHGV